MANLLSILKLFSNITDTSHPHNNKLMSGYPSNSLLLPLQTVYVILLSSQYKGQSQQNLTQGT